MSLASENFPKYALNGHLKKGKGKKSDTITGNERFGGELAWDDV